jgi:hypothetical protein
MATSEDISRRLKKLRGSELEQLSEIVDFMVEKSRKAGPQKELKVNVDLVAVIIDSLKEDLEPISIRAKTIIKHMNAGHFNNRKISHLANTIVELADKCDNSILAIQSIATPERVGARRCNCDITDLWNGKGCTCGGV